MLKYTARRIILMVPTLLLVTIGVFLLLQLSPGDPVLMMIPPDEAVGLTDAELEAMRHELGLDRPLVVQYVDWLVNVIQGDWGRSIFLRQPVLSLIETRFMVTAELALFSVSLATIIAIPIGIYAGIRPGSIGDTVGNIIALMGASAPNFWVAFILIVVFAVQLNWVRAGGFVHWERGWVEHLEGMILPTITLGTGLMGITMRIARSSMLEVMNENYIRSARAKGLSESRVIYVHALRNALIAIITTIGLQIGRILGGTVIIEQIFGFPGMGKLLLDAIFSRDFPVVQGSVLVITVSFLFVNLVIDLLYAFIDPRIRYD